MTVWFTSDLHLGHQREFLYSPRGFDNVEDHDTVIISNINEIVMKDDTLYILGDLVLNNTENGINLLKKINCQDIRIIIGNHDTDARIFLYHSLDNVVSVEYGGRFRYKKWHFFLSHYPTMSANIDDDISAKKKVWNLCGHSHTKNRYFHFEHGCYHVELDAHNNYPVRIEDIISDIAASSIC